MGRLFPRTFLDNEFPAPYCDTHYNQKSYHKNLLENNTPLYIGSLSNFFHRRLLMRHIFKNLMQNLKKWRKISILRRHK